MSRRDFELEWDRRKQYLYKSLFTEAPALSPIPEYPLQNPGGEVLTRDRDPSPPPPLIIEIVPRRRDDDEPEEFYIKLERKLKKYYKILFNLQTNDDSSSTEFDEEIYGYNPFDFNNDGDLNRAFISDVGSSNECSRDEGDDEIESENSSSYEDIDEEIEDDQITGSRVVASTYIIDDERGDNNEEQEEIQECDESDGESAHSLILCSNVTRRHRESRRESRDADTLQNLRVDENWTVPTFQLEAERRLEETQDDNDEDVEANTLDVNNNKTLEIIDEEENSDHYETIDIEEVHIGDVEMRRKEITPQRSPTVTTERSLSPIITSFTRPLDLSNQSIEYTLSQKDQSSIENQYYKVSLAPRTSTPRKPSRKRTGDDNLDVIPAKLRNIGVQTSREFLLDVDTQTEFIGKNVSVQVNLSKAMTKKVVARWR